jgi:hypothetical protein
MSSTEEAALITRVEFEKRRLETNVIISQWPIRVHGEHKDRLGSVCTVCQAKFELDDCVCSLPCCHEAHKRCLDSLLFDGCWRCCAECNLSPPVGDWIAVCDQSNGGRSDQTAALKSRLSLPVASSVFWRLGAAMLGKSSSSS